MQQKNLVLKISQQNYMNKLQISKLPKADSVNIEFEGE